MKGSLISYHHTTSRHFRPQLSFCLCNTSWPSQNHNCLHYTSAVFFRINYILDFNPKCWYNKFPSTEDFKYKLWILFFFCSILKCFQMHFSHCKVWKGGKMAVTVVLVHFGSHRAKKTNLAVCNLIWQSMKHKSKHRIKFKMIISGRKITIRWQFQNSHWALASPYFYKS